MSDEKNAFYHIVLDELLNSRYDNVSTKDENYAEQLKSVHKEFVKRNNKLTGLLDDYIDNRRERIKTNDFLKKFIFWLFVVLLVLLTVAVVIVFIKVDINNANIASVASLVSVAVTYLGSLLSIFKIMSTYLFPIDEEKDTIEMIKAVIENDIKVEQIMSDAIKENESSDTNKLKIFKELYDEHILNEKEYKELKGAVFDKIKRNLKDQSDN